METINLTKEVLYRNIYNETTFTIGDSVCIYNDSNNEVYVQRGGAIPTEVNTGIPVRQGKHIYITGESNSNIWVGGSDGKVVVQRTTDQIADFKTVDLPADVWTSKNPTTRRLQVDPSQTGFEEGREFYCLADAVILAGQSKDYIFNFTKDVLFQASFVTVVEGDITLEVWGGGTDDGNMLTPITVFNANTMSDTPVVATGTTKFTDGIYNLDGTKVDYIRIKTDTNSNKSIGADVEFLRVFGVPAGSYYFHFVNNSGSSQASFIIKERWEERPSQYS